MKFDEMVSNNNATKKVNILKFVIIGVVAITIFLVLYFILKIRVSYLKDLLAV